MSSQSQVTSTCPACEAKRQHTEAELKTYHPLAGHGYTSESGWTHVSLEPK